jgi:hypothetical protein
MLFGELNTMAMHNCNAKCMLTFFFPYQQEKNTSLTEETIILYLGTLHTNKRITIMCGLSTYLKLALI